MFFNFSLQHMARTKQTACKSDSKGKLTQVTFAKPSTEPDSTSTMDKPRQAPTDIDTTQGMQPQATEPSVDLKLLHKYLLNCMQKQTRVRKIL